MTGTKKRPTKPRDTALAPQLLTRVFHQPALIYFIAVARYASIREAARQLNIASSAVTRQIALLEDALGMALFHRTNQRMRLTSAGEILYRHARRLTATDRSGGVRTRNAAEGSRPASSTSPPSKASG